MRKTKVGAVHGDARSNELVGLQQKRLRYCNSQCLGGLQIDRQINPGGDCTGRSAGSAPFEIQSTPGWPGISQACRIESRCPDMRVHFDAMCLRQGHDVSCRSDSAARAQIRLSNVDRMFAEQLIDRLPIVFAGKIPQRDVDRADGRHHRTLAAEVAGGVIHLVPEHFDIERIGAKD